MSKTKKLNPEEREMVDRYYESKEYKARMDKYHEGKNYAGMQRSTYDPIALKTVLQDKRNKGRKNNREESKKVEQGRANKMSTNTTVTAKRSNVEEARKSISGPNARPTKPVAPPTPPKKMNHGGSITNTTKKTNKVRGSGIAIQGVRPAKIR
mgnify:FL=1|tara:strand:- start:2096 stop:2554 length:459 start_codon:yes stop_codon:yes gene_type:complete